MVEQLGLFVLFGYSNFGLQSTLNKHIIDDSFFKEADTHCQDNLFSSCFHYVFLFIIINSFIDYDGFLLLGPLCVTEKLCTTINLRFPVNKPNCERTF